MGRSMNVHWVCCEIVVALELRAGGLMTNKWYPWGVELFEVRLK